MPHRSGGPLLRCRKWGSSSLEPEPWKKPSSGIVAPTTRSDRGGYFTLRAPQGSTYPLLVTHMQYEARLLPIHMGGQPVAIQVSRKAWLPDQPTSEPTIVLPALRNPWPAVLVGEAAVVLFAGVGLWMLIRAMRFRRWATRLRLGSESLGLGSVPDTLFPSVDTRRVAAHLRRSRRSGQDALAVGPTVRRSTERAGYFSPVYRWRTGIPAYVALIRRVSPRDQLAAFHEVLVRRLREYQVRIETFYFREDPSICFSRDGAAYPLERVASRFPAHALFVFCEPEQFRNPERVGPAAWLAAATAAWEDVVLLVQRADFGAAAHTRAADLRADAGGSGIVGSRGSRARPVGPGISTHPPGILRGLARRAAAICARHGPSLGRVAPLPGRRRILVPGRVCHLPSHVLGADHVVRSTADP